MEAEGIEPSSRDVPNGGLYMHSRCFDLDRRRRPSTVFAGIQPSLFRYRTKGGIRQASPLFCSRPDAGIRSCRGCLLIRQPYEAGRHEADSPCNIIVGSYGLLESLTRPYERPRHATATVAIRSKPIAPGVV